MKIIKFNQFIKEEFNSTPEDYISIVLKRIKKKIDAIFGQEEMEEKPQDKEEKLTFKDLGIEFASSEISLYSEEYDSLTVKFRDDEAEYSMWIMIELGEANKKDASADSVKKCYVKMKKYDISTYDLLDWTEKKDVDIDDLDEDFIVELKIKLDGEESGEKELKYDT